MPEIPNDLVRLADLVKEMDGKPSRSWWDIQVAQGKIKTYKVPGDKGLYVSKAEVDAVLKPHVHERSEESSAG